MPPGPGPPQFCEAPSAAAYIAAPPPAAMIAAIPTAASICRALKPLEVTGHTLPAVDERRLCAHPVPDMRAWSQLTHRADKFDAYVRWQLSAS